MATDNELAVDKQTANIEINDSSSNRDSLLLVTDSYADLARCLTDQCNVTGYRHNSVSRAYRNERSDLDVASSASDAGGIRTFRRSVSENDRENRGYEYSDTDSQIANLTLASDTQIDSGHSSSGNSEYQNRSSTTTSIQNSGVDEVDKSRMQLNDCTSSIFSAAVSDSEESQSNVHEVEDNHENIDSEERSSTNDDTGPTQSSHENIMSLSTRSEDEVDYLQDEEWKQHAKHFFILSSAGKPIYSYHGSEDKLVTVMGVMQALVSVVQDNGDALRSIRAGGHQFVFLVREHLTLVAVVQDRCNFIQHILVELNYIYNQILSVLTYSQLKRIFEQRHNYDLRRMLSGSERFMDNLIDMMQVDAGFLLGAVRCVPIASSARDNITHSIVQHCSKVKDLVFAIILAGNNLVTLVHMKRYYLHPMDLHLIINLVNSSESFKGSETWTPVCLPNLNDTGYLHAHISYLDEHCKLCLLLMTVDRDMFYTLSDCKAKILQRLIKQRSLRVMLESIQHIRYPLADIGITDLRHFLYKSKHSSQYTCPDYQPPYDTPKEIQRLFGLYQYLHHRIHNTTRPLKLLFHVGPHETLLGWVTGAFELYTVFSPLVTKTLAVNSVDALLKWISTKEDKFFINKSATF